MASADVSTGASTETPKAATVDSECSSTSANPDGNGWPLQEITTRLPGREWED